MRKSNWREGIYTEEKTLANGVLAVTAHNHNGNGDGHQNCRTEFRGSGERYSLQQFAEMFAKGLTKAQGRSYVVHVDQVDGRFQVVAEIRDSGKDPMDVHDIAEAMGESVKTVRAWNNRRTCHHEPKCLGPRCKLALKCFKPGKHLKVNRIDFDAWKTAWANEPPKPPAPRKGKIKKH